MGIFVTKADDGRIENVFDEALYPSSGTGKKAKRHPAIPDDAVEIDDTEGRKLLASMQFENGPWFLKDGTITRTSDEVSG